MTIQQKSLTDGFEKYRKKTRKKQFLEDMDTIIPWKGLVEAIEPFYSWPQGVGRGPCRYRADVTAEHAPGARDFTQKTGSRNRSLSDKERASNRHKSKVRAKVEHVFGVMQGRFGFTRVRYRGLAKMPITCSSPAPWPIW